MKAQFFCKPIGLPLWYYCINLKEFLKLQANIYIYINLYKKEKDREKGYSVIATVNTISEKL